MGGQGTGDSAHTGDAAGLDFLDNWPDVGGERIGESRAGFDGGAPGGVEARPSSPRHRTGFQV